MKESFINTTKKKRQDNIYHSFLFILSSMIVFFVVLAFLLIFIKGLSGFFEYDGLKIREFLFGNYYDGVTYFAAGFMIINTIWVSIVALIVALPISIFTAIFISRILPKQYRSFFYATIAILAAIPSVIFGAFAKVVIDFIITSIFGIAPGSALTVIIMLAFMIMPTITILTINSINAVDRKLEDSSLALGATRSQTSFNVTLRAASKGIVVASLLGIGRAVGEATAVSMVASQPNAGPTFGLFENIRLLTSTMLQGFVEIAPGTIQEASLYAMVILLIITISLIFILMKYLENKTDADIIAKKQYEKLSQNRRIEAKVKTSGVESLDKFEQKVYINYRVEKTTNNEKYHKQKKNKERAKIKQRTIFKTSGAKHKKKVSSRETTFTFIFSIFGFALLSSIILFLLIGGVDALSWDYLTTSGEWKTIEFNTGQSVTLYGLSTALFGTLYTIIITLVIAIPLGVLIGFYFCLYSDSNSRYGKIFLFFISVLTGIPSLVYGIIAILIFIPLVGLIEIYSLAGALIMAIVVLPIIIKTTEEAILSINKNQEQGSLSLGATKYITSRKVLLIQIFPSIISASILSMGRIIGESAIFIVIYGTANSSTSGEWVANGGTTLATEIYKLTLLETIPWDYVKAIGLVIIILIFLISILSTYIEKRKTFESITFGLGFLFIILSILFVQLWLFFISIILLISVPIFFPIYKRINKNNKQNNFFKNKIYDFNLKYRK